MDGIVYELPSQIELSRDEYRAINAGLEAGLEACDLLVDGSSIDLTSTIEVALRLLAHRIWPELGALDDNEEN